MAPSHKIGPVAIDDDLVDIGVGPLFGPLPVVVTRASDLLRIRFSFTNLKFDTVDGQVVLVRRVANRPALLTVDHPPQALMEKAGLELEDPPIQWPARPVLAYLGRTTRLVYSVGSAQVPWSLEGFLEACATLPLNLAPAARIEPSPRIRFPKRGPSIVSAVTTGTLRAAQVRTGRITARTAPAVANILASSHRAVVAARVLQHRLGETESIPALAGLHAAPALGLVGLVDDHIDLEPIVIALKPKPRRPAATETAVELPWRLALSPGPSARWAHATSPVDHGGRTELWHTRLARQVGDTTAESGQWVRAIWARDFDQFPDALAEPGDATKFPPTEGGGDSPNFTSALTSARRMRLSHETANFQLLRSGKPWDPPVVNVEHLMLTSQGGWLDSSFTTTTVPNPNLGILEWRHVATQGRDHFVKVVELGSLLPFGHRSTLTTIAERKFTSDDPTVPAQPGNPAYVVRRQFITVVERTRSYPSTHVYLDGRLYAGPVPNPQPKRLDLVMPFSSVSILTTTTALIDPHDDPANPALEDAFFPMVGGNAFPFKILATDREGNVVEYAGPMMFVASPLNAPPLIDAVIEKYWNSPDGLRRHNLGGQKIAFAPSTWDGTALATTKATKALYWDDAHDGTFDGLPPEVAKYAPMLRQAVIVDPAMSALAGKGDSITVKYPSHYTAKGLQDNAAHVFLALDGAPATMSFSSQANKSGGLVQPNLDITGFSGSTGPIGGDLAKAVTNTPTPADFFKGLGNPKLFGIVPLAELLDGIDVGGFPRFVADQVNRVTALERDLAKVVALGTEIPARVASLPEAGSAEATALTTSLQGVAAAATPILGTLAAYAPGGPLAAQLTTLGGTLGALADAVTAAAFVPKALAADAAGVTRRLQEQTADAATLVGLVDQVFQGVTLPESVSATMNWSTQFRAWPSGNAVFQPTTADGTKAAKTSLDLRVQLQAPTTLGKEPTASAVCTLSSFALQLVGDGFFIRLNVTKIEFSMVVGRKVDVSVDLREGNAVEFGGPLTWVNALRDFIPFDGFTDPPYLDVSPSGIKAGFDLALPPIPLGVVNLANVSLGAQMNVPFIGESLDFRFSFCTRERPFHLTVWVFGGGGFFAITVTPKECKILEAAFEFGAAAAIDFGVASGSIEVMAGIYFRLETGNSELTGYFRLRGEVDVLGLISASIELYLELSYEIDTKTARGRAELTIEIEIAFFSTSVTIECEKKFKGSDQDPTFAEVMGPDAGGDVAVSPWAVYCDAFAAA